MSEMRNVILEIVCEPISFTICVVVVNRESTFRLDSFMLAKETSRLEHTRQGSDSR